jgi:proteasome lid subunit RPN8/RPN11
MAPPLSRVKREQLRKRRNNLLRRHNEFWLLYGMKCWLIMELPDGQIFTYHSHPDTPPPSREDMVRQN